MVVPVLLETEAPSPETDRAPHSDADNRTRTSRGSERKADFDRSRRVRPEETAHSFDSKQLNVRTVMLILPDFCTWLPVDGPERPEVRRWPTGNPTTPKNSPMPRLALHLGWPATGRFVRS